MKALIMIVFVLLLGGCRGMMSPDTRVYHTPRGYPAAWTEVTVASADGTRLRGWRFEPIEGDTVGTFVLFGGINSNSSSLFPEWLWVTEAGYDLLIVDYRGYGRSEGSFEVEGGISDVQAVLTYLERRDGRPVIACGQSMGGSLLINALSHGDYPDVRLAVIDSTFRSFAAMGRIMMQRSILFFPLSWLPSLLVPDAINAEENVAAVGVPLLFVAGSEDRLVDPENSEYLYRDATVPKALWSVEGAGHVRTFDDPEVREALAAIMADSEGIGWSPRGEMRIFR
jgi:alpha-beta hydrolase superfamily lysophospholipase